MRIRAESVLIASLFIPVQHLFISFIPVGYQQEVTLNNALILSLVVQFAYNECAIDDGNINEYEGIDLILIS